MTTLKIKSLTPMRDQILVSADRYPKEEHLVQGAGRILRLKEISGDVKEFQTIKAVGPTAAQYLKVGDKVMINFLRYRVANSSEKFNQQGNEDVIAMEDNFSVRLPIVKVDDEDCMLLYSNDVIYKFEGEEVEED